MDEFLNASSLDFCFSCSNLPSASIMESVFQTTGKSVGQRANPRLQAGGKPTDTSCPIWLIKSNNFFSFLPSVSRSIRGGRSEYFRFSGFLNVLIVLGLFILIFKELRLNQ